MHDSYGRAIPRELTIDVASVARAIDAFIADRLVAHRRDGAVLGLSGGLDSAVVAAVAARALGPRRVLGLIMPERDSSPQSERDARELATQLGIRVEVIDLTPALATLGIYGQLPINLLPPGGLRAATVRAFYNLFSRRPGQRLFRRYVEGTGAAAGLPGRIVAAGKAYASIKHRLRMVCLYYRAETENLLVLGTCNRTEEQVGFFVRYGDSAADIAPIQGLYKTQVLQLARYLGVTRAILEKPPSPDLLPGITDEFALGLSYETLDRVVFRLEQRMNPEAIAQELGLEVQLVDYVAALRQASQPMRELAERGPLPGS